MLSGDATSTAHLNELVDIFLRASGLTKMGDTPAQPELFILGSRRPRCPARGPCPTSGHLGSAPNSRSAPNSGAPQTQPGCGRLEGITPRVVAVRGDIAKANRSGMGTAKPDPKAASPARDMARPAAGPTQSPRVGLH
jgi:hypothetical protein